MRCKTCDYPLWQITDRRCPECGTPFLPSEHEFILNSVKFCCPHCNQDYYGTGEKGHLVPRSFACVKCANRIDMDQMVLLPAEGVTERQTEVTVVPWVERRERNWFTAFFVTMGMAIANPNRTIEAVPEGSPATRAIAYMAIHVAVQMTCSCIVFVLGMVGMGISASSGMGAAFGMAGGYIFTLLAIPTLVLVWAALAHVTLRMTGGTASGFSRTVHAVCYSAGNGFLMDIPCLGFYLSPFAMLWWGISAGCMLSRAQRVSAGRAVLATLLPILLTVGLLVGGIVLAISVASRRAAAMSAAIAASPTTTVPGGTLWTSTDHAASGMANRLQMFASGSGGVLPAHAAEMILDNRGWPSEFVVPGSATLTQQILVAGRPASQVVTLRSAEKRKLRQDLHNDEALDRPAHRVGDWVFTHTGITPDMHDDGLWLAVGWWDPAVNVIDPIEVPVAMPNYKFAVIPIGEFDAALLAQNQLRAGHGLPALPHPRTVRLAAKPASAPSTPRDASEPVPDNEPAGQ